MNTKVKVGFEGLATTSETSLDNGYDGFDWQNFYAIDKAEYPATGYIPHSGHATGLNAFEAPATVSSVDTFAFKKGYFSGAWDDGLTITVQGFRHGVLVAVDSFVVNYGENQLHQFSRAFHKLDSVTFSTSGGTDHDAADSGSGAHMSVDDLVFVMHTPVLADLA